MTFELNGGILPPKYLIVLQIRGVSKMLRARRGWGRKLPLAPDYVSFIQAENASFPDILWVCRPAWRVDVG